MVEEKVELASFLSAGFCQGIRAMLLSFPAVERYRVDECWRTYGFKKLTFISENLSLRISVPFL